MIIKGLEFDCTGEMCPEQYDVYNANGRQVGYVRLRWGYLRCYYPECLGEVIYGTEIGGEYTGCFENDEQRMEHLYKIADRILEKLSESTVTA